MDAVGAYAPLGRTVEGRTVYKMSDKEMYLFYWATDLITDGDAAWFIGDTDAPLRLEHTLARSNLGSDAACPTGTSWWRATGTTSTPNPALVHQSTGQSTA